MLFNYYYTDEKRNFLNLRNKQIAGADIDLVLHGDSIMEGFNLNRLTVTNKIIVNSGIGGDRIHYMYKRMTDDVINLKPTACLFMGGINDVRAWLNDDITSDDITYIINHIVTNYQKIIKTCMENSVMIYPCLLIKNNEPEKNSTFMNAIIDQINRELIKLEDSINVKFIDFNPIICNELGKLSMDLSSDGLHPNDFGYLKMCDVLTKLGIL